MSDPFHSFHLDNKVAIITGASSGIGAQTAKLFSSVGATVIAAARRLDRLEKLAEEVPNVIPKWTLQKSPLFYVDNTHRLHLYNNKSIGPMYIYIYIYIYI